ncbi:hypothetical protein [Patulibacter defluvii]|uniref:hypothetical protein n=1 Tax=Patulibacter defluvii TaxID=3095358 RepID=UPI002A75B23D|nr:hypothetical protein [Patulibacter sp. DM4]
MLVVALRLLVAVALAVLSVAADSIVCLVGASMWFLLVGVEFAERYGPTTASITLSRANALELADALRTAALAVNSDEPMTMKVVGSGR